ncbi:hypothetical protein HYH03_005803 [Edaphochlamys debaryana]|uniref:PARP-type domain-containing protein n=1 Tax=Edaphochlamys debaryana TaxID=47281 RepID=A0A835YEM8_9CHLO|nr:hypothetical protein HYH03_005803 [Edaphochlamys debaryana]|eukprot:KAG2496204.1 hypothetical protein HYH03_005803 [Edaphochlamys debaryana]
MVRHYIEYDPSGRATCKTCKHKIPKGALRLCVNQSLETSEMQQKDYRHLVLACLDPATLRGVVRHTFDLDRLVAALQARGQGGPADQAKARSVMERALKTVPAAPRKKQGMTEAEAEAEAGAVAQAQLMSALAAAGLLPLMSPLAMPMQMQMPMQFSLPVPFQPPPLALAPPTPTPAPKAPAGAGSAAGKRRRTRAAEDDDDEAYKMAASDVTRLGSLLLHKDISPQILAKVEPAARRALRLVNRALLAAHDEMIASIYVPREPTAKDTVVALPGMLSRGCRPKMVSIALEGDVQQQQTGALRLLRSFANASAVDPLPTRSLDLNPTALSKDTVSLVAAAFPKLEHISVSNYNSEPLDEDTLASGLERLLSPQHGTSSVTKLDVILSWRQQVLTPALGRALRTGSGLNELLLGPTLDGIEQIIPLAGMTNLTSLSLRGYCKPSLLQPLLSPLTALAKLTLTQGGHHFVDATGALTAAGEAALCDVAAFLAGRVDEESTFDIRPARKGWRDPLPLRGTAECEAGPGASRRSHRLWLEALGAAGVPQLMLTGFVLSHGDMVALASYSRLKVLILGGAIQIPPSALLLLARTPRLKTLRLNIDAWRGPDKRYPLGGAAGAREVLLGLNVGNPHLNVELDRSYSDKDEVLAQLLSLIAQVRIFLRILPGGGPYRVRLRRPVYVTLDVAGTIQERQVNTRRLLRPFADVSEVEPLPTQSVSLNVAALSEETASLLAAAFPRLERVSLNSSTMVGPEVEADALASGLKRLLCSEVCPPSLSTLHVRVGCEVTPALVSAMATGAPRLRELRLVPSLLNSAEQVLPLASMTNLTALYLLDCEAQFLQPLLSPLTALVKLSLAEVTGTEGLPLSLSGADVPCSLGSLSVQQNRLEISSLKHLPNLTSLYATALAFPTERLPLGASQWPSDWLLPPKLAYIFLTQQPPEVLAALRSSPVRQLRWTLDLALEGGHHFDGDSGALTAFGEAALCDAARFLAGRMGAESRVNVRLARDWHVSFPLLGAADGGEGAAVSGRRSHTAWLEALGAAGVPCLGLHGVRLSHLDIAALASHPRLKTLDLGTPAEFPASALLTFGCAPRLTALNLDIDAWRSPDGSDPLGGAPGAREALLGLNVGNPHLNVELECSDTYEDGVREQLRALRSDLGEALRLLPGGGPNRLRIYDL